MSRSFDLDDVEQREHKDEGPSSVEGLSRSGGEKRPRVSEAAEESAGFGENRRARYFERGREYRIRPSEEAALRTLGMFRVVREADLTLGVYGQDKQLAEADMRSLHRQGLVRSIRFQSLGTSPDRVLTLSREGYGFIINTKLQTPQFFYWGMVKPSEVEHDSLLYRAFLRERRGIRESGGTVRRVVLDYELKREHFRRTNAPGQQYRERQNASAQELHLPVVEGHVVFPDFRVEYETERGEVARADIEVATENYRGKHLAVKAAAGFRIYASSGAGGGLRVESGPRLKGRIFPEESRTVFSL